jgi:hypothetical protein
MYGRTSCAERGAGPRRASHQSAGPTTSAAPVMASAASAPGESSRSASIHPPEKWRA